MQLRKQSCRILKKMCNQLFKERKKYFICKTSHIWRKLGIKNGIFPKAQI